MDSEQANKIFTEMLDVMEFQLIKDNEGYGLIDLQNGNLGDIQSDRFESGTEIIDRLGIYIDDYFLNPIDDTIEYKEMEDCFKSEDIYSRIKELLQMRENPDEAPEECIALINEIGFDLDVMDLVLNHFESIVLKDLMNDTEKDNLTKQFDFTLQEEKLLAVLQDQLNTNEKYFHWQSVAKTSVCDGVLLSLNSISENKEFGFTKDEIYFKDKSSGETQRLPKDYFTSNKDTEKRSEKAVNELTKTSDITQGYYSAEDPTYENDEKGISVEFLLTMDDDTYEKFVSKTQLIENSEYENFAELLDSDDYVNVYANVYENGTVTAAVGIGGGDYYDVPLSENEQEFLLVMIADECNLQGGKSLDEMLKEAVEEYDEPNIIDITNLPETWKKTIEDNRADIEEKMSKAYSHSIANQLTNISVCMKPDGETYLFEDFARYDRVPESVYNGQDLVVAKFSSNENDMERFVKTCEVCMTNEQLYLLKESMAENNVDTKNYQEIAGLIGEICPDEFIEKMRHTLTEQYDASKHLSEIVKDNAAEKDGKTKEISASDNSAKDRKNKSDYER